MMTQQHVHQQIPDYVLGLLPWQKQQQVEQHTLVCPDCRLVLQREQELGQLVHNTLAAAAQPPANLRRFMPAVPQKSRPEPSFGFSFNWQRQLIPLTLVLFLLVGSLGFYLREQRGLWHNPTPTALAITATLTDSPTATITETRAEQALNLRATAVPANTSQPEITATPAPNPTPIAALNVKRET
jgi:hypothetical protein